MQWTIICDSLPLGVLTGSRTPLSIAHFVGRELIGWKSAMIDFLSLDMLSRVAGSTIEMALLVASETVDIMPRLSLLQRLPTG